MLKIQTERQDLIEGYLELGYTKEEASKLADKDLLEYISLVKKANKYRQLVSERTYRIWETEYSPSNQEKGKKAEDNSIIWSTWRAL